MFARPLLALCCLASASLLSAAEVDFSHEIVPLLKQQCGKCHAGSQKKGGLSLNLRETLLAGGESGASVVVGKSGESELVSRITSTDKNLRMPPEGEPLTSAQVALIKRWIDEGLKWEDGFSFGPKIYEPPLAPRRPELPAALPGRDHPVDRILDHYLTTNKIAIPQPVDDRAFARRAYLDLIGLLPTPEELERFTRDASPTKRTQLVRELLSRDVDYAEHWLTFWNDLLRNDYAGTGFITGGRKQISKWLYEALVTNKPYDQMARELIAPPTADSAGFADGIRWRGEVSAGQTVEIQFAQSVGQALLGINLKCASCHDSFVDRWTLDDSYGLAAIYANKPLQIHRCDKPVGRTAQAAWLFPEIGQIDPNAPQPARLKQLAALMTKPENGRFSRTIVNRLWQRLMGRGIVHPVDAMQTAPWNADLLDYLASRLTEEHFDLKKILELIATSQAYQSQTESVVKDADQHGYHYAGPRAKRMTAEQFVDCMWQMTSAAPNKFDAPVLRGKREPAANQPSTPTRGRWIWSYANVQNAPAGEAIALRKKFTLSAVPSQAVAVMTCDNSFTCFVNGQKLAASDNWEEPTVVHLTPRLKNGDNEILVLAKNGGSGPNPAAFFFEARWLEQDAEQGVVSDGTWQWTKHLPKDNGKFAEQPTDWQAAAVVDQEQIWSARLGSQLGDRLQQGAAGAKLMVRASLLKSNFLMRSLGRPNRDQIVSVRPVELTTLEAMDLSNGQEFVAILRRGGQTLAARKWNSPDELITWTYHFALSRDPQPAELTALREALGDTITPAAVEDMLWSVVMLPEFQIVR